MNTKNLNNPLLPKYYNSPEDKLMMEDPNASQVPFPQQKEFDIQALLDTYKNLSDKPDINIPYNNNINPAMSGMPDGPPTNMDKTIVQENKAQSNSPPAFDARLREETSNPRDIDFSYDKLQDILKNRDASGLNNVMLRAGMMANQGIAKMGNAGTGSADVKPDEGALQALGKQADMPLENFSTKMRAYGEIENQDPKSDISKFARDRAKASFLQMDPNAKVGQLDNMSAAQLEKLGLFNKQGVDQFKMLQYQLDVQRMNNLQEQRGYQKEQAEENINLKKEEFTNKKVQSLNERIGKEAGDILNAFDGIDKELLKVGIPKLTDLKINKNQILNLQGKKVDLPGTNIPGLGRTAIPFTGADKFQSALDSLKNITLKDRSGAAVTDSEFNRLQKEFSEKRFTDESDMLNSVLRMREALGNDLARIEAGYPSEAINEYRSRPGSVNSDVFKAKQKADAPKKEKSTTSKFPMQVRKGNQVATVSNEEELAEANQEGFQ